MSSAGPLIVPAVVFAQLRVDLELILLAILLIVLIVAGCIAVVRVRRWRDVESTPVSLEDHLQSYQVLVERGELDPREMEKIIAHLQKRQDDKPPKPPKPPEPQPETGIQAQRPPKTDVPPDTRIQ